MTQERPYRFLHSSPLLLELPLAVDSTSPKIPQAIPGCLYMPFFRVFRRMQLLWVGRGPWSKPPSCSWKRWMKNTCLNVFSIHLSALRQSIATPTHRNRQKNNTDRGFSRCRSKSLGAIIGSFQAYSSDDVFYAMVKFCVRMMVSEDGKLLAFPHLPARPAGTIFSSTYRRAISLWE